MFKKVLDKKFIIALMVVWAGFLGCMPTGISAMPADSRETVVAGAQEGVDKVNILLSNAALMKKLGRMGLSRDEVKGMFARLSDAQLHRLALRADALKAGGGDAGIAVIALLVMLLTFFFTLHLTGHKIRLNVEQKAQPVAEEEIIVE